MSAILATARRTSTDLASFLQRAWSGFRPQMSQEALALLTGVALTLLFNVAFFRAVHATGALHGVGGLANVDVTPLTRVEPIYALPEDVAELRVTLKFRVDEHGRVIDPQIAESSQTAFDQAALKAIRYWQFLPKLKNGKPVAGAAKLPLRVTRSSQAR